MKLKKIFLAFTAVFLLASENSFSQRKDDDAKQTLIPRDLFIGDRGIIRYSFTSPIDFFSVAGIEKKDSFTMQIDPEIFIADPESCTVEKINFTRNGVDYFLDFEIIPWKTGEIRFRNFDLMRVCMKANGESDSVGGEFLVRLESIKILSLADKLGAKILRPSEGPLLVPGTSYIIWTLVAVSLAALTALCIFLLRLPYFLRRISVLKRRFSLYKNASSAKRKLRILAKKKLTDKDFAQEFQIVVKKYLEFRFGTSFASVTGKNFINAIEDIVGGELPDEILGALEDMTQIFVRMNYIRFAQGSIDSKLLPREKYEAAFVGDEKSVTLKKMTGIIDILEKGYGND